jgi:pimeloyl-ACP methyl ester carboxylesterase
MSELHKISGCVTEANADVLFIHGLGGDAFGTWRAGRDNSTSWPHWVGDEFPQVGVWSLGYAASPSRWACVFGWLSRIRWLQRFSFFRWLPVGTNHSGCSMPLPRRAAQVLDLMVQHNFGKRPIIMVCHSLGGLLAKQILRLAAETGQKDRKRSVFTQTHAVLFLSTPHCGATLASLANAFGSIFRTTVSIADLQTHDAHLEELQNWYRRHAGDNAIRTVTYYETKPVMGLVIVNPTSAQPGVGEDPVALDEDHVSIAKPSAPDAQVCEALRGLLRDAIAPGQLIQLPGNAVRCDGAAAVKAKGVSALRALRATGSRQVLLEVGQTALMDGGPQIRSNALKYEQVLFDVYDLAYEDFYLKRNVDRDIRAIVKCGGVWLSGPSGCGKTNALRRSLYQARRAFEFIDLSKCVGASVPELFAGLHMEIAGRLGVELEQGQVTANGYSQSYYIDAIAKLIERHLQDDMCLIIDEIPLDEASFAPFLDGVAAIVVTLGNRNVQRNPLLLASIGDPGVNLKPFQNKVHERLQMLRLPAWSKNEMRALLDLVSHQLPMHLAAADNVKILNSANGSPRSMKIMLRNWCRFHDNPDWSLDRVISELPPT